MKWITESETGQHIPSDDDFSLTSAGAIFALVGYDTFLFPTDIPPYMNLDERLRNLCQQGKRAQAVMLAGAACRNEPVEAIAIDDTLVHIDTPRFHGIHRLTTDRRNDLDVRSYGEYTYKSDTVELSFSTATVHPQAYDRILDDLASRNGADPQTDDDTRPFPEETNPPASEAAPTAPARSRTSPIGFLKGLF